jgi:hypothetical protein
MILPAGRLSFQAQLLFPAQLRFSRAGRAMRGAELGPARRRSPRAGHPRGTRPELNSKSFLRSADRRAADDFCRVLGVRGA